MLHSGKCGRRLGVLEWRESKILDVKGFLLRDTDIYSFLFLVFI